MDDPTDPPKWALRGGKATPRPWRVYNNGVCWQINGELNAVVTTQFCYSESPEADAALVVTAVNAHDALVAERDTLKAEVDNLRARECVACGGPYPNEDCGHLKNARDLGQQAPCAPVQRDVVDTLRTERDAVIAERDWLRQQVEDLEADASNDYGKYLALKHDYDRLRQALKEAQCAGAQIIRVYEQYEGACHAAIEELRVALARIREVLDDGDLEEGKK